VEASQIWQRLQPLTLTLAAALQARGETLACAESCTGGLLSALCTDLPGSSLWFDRAWVTYSNAAKSECLGVPEAMIEAQGAVSEPVARAMVQGALAHSRAHWAVAITGIAGPGGGSADKPVGTVWLGWGARSGEVHTRLLRLDGDRAAIREASVQQALVSLLGSLDALPAQDAPTTGSTIETAVTAQVADPVAAPLAAPVTATLAASVSEPSRLASGGELH
jgi:nicotinamide-nucleotide amidase